VIVSNKKSSPDVRIENISHLDTGRKIVEISRDVKFKELNETIEENETDV
jgi:hypothetical protein